MTSTPSVNLINSSHKSSTSDNVNTISLFSNTLTNQSDTFDIIKLIGRGSYGKVFLVKMKNNNQIYAMKALKKSSLLNKSKHSLFRALTEKKILQTSQHPFINKLKFSFQNKSDLYMVFPFCQGGELRFHLNKIGRFSETAARIYSAQVLLALEYLHENNIVYRE